MRIGPMELSLLLSIPISIAIYMLPTIIAAWRRHPNTIAIFLIDLLLGWTFVGWIAQRWCGRLSYRNHAHLGLSILLSRLLKGAMPRERLPWMSLKKSRGMFLKAYDVSEKATNAIMRIIKLHIAAQFGRNVDELLTA